MTGTSEPIPAAVGFWGHAWLRAARRPGAIFGLCWIGLVAAIAVLAPLLASGHPLLMHELDPAGRARETSSPLLAHLSALDIVLVAGAAAGALFLLFPGPARRAARGRLLARAGLQAVATLVIAAAIRDSVGSGAAIPLSIGVGFVFLLVPSRLTSGTRLVHVVAVVIVCAAALSLRWREPLARFDYREREAAGQVACTYTLIPYSPLQSDPSRYLRPPRSKPAGGPPFLLGTDAVGQDVLSQLLHACRLALSVGIIATGLALTIGITIGALAGYVGGWVDLLLQRLIEIFMAVPVLVLLVVVAGVLPPQARSAHVMMAVIGCVSWTGAARFTRAEFLKLRNQDYVQAARAGGLPLSSILFRHMLPNGVTPVLVDASFAVAGAILAEATLSYLGLGPIDRASWGKLLAGAAGSSGRFAWWLAVFPGAAIFLTILSCNLIGEALRDAIDTRDVTR